MINILGPYAGFVLPLAAFLIVALVTWVAFRLLTGRRKAARDDELSSASDGLFGALTPALASQMPESEKQGLDFRKALRGAGLYSPHAAATFYALRFVLFFTPLVVAGILVLVEDPRHTFRILFIGALCGAFLSVLPKLYVTMRRRRRQAQIREGLPDTMDMLAMCMEGGIGLSSSLNQVADKLDSYPALAEELLILKRQSEVGSLKKALADMADRVDLPEVRGLAALLTRSDRLGTKLSGSLWQQSDHMRTSRRQRATLAANKTPVKLVLPLLFCFAPAALILLVAPAVLELKEFLAPSNGSSVLNAGDGLNTSGILDTIENLDQDVEF